MDVEVVDNVTFSSLEWLNVTEGGGTGVVVSSSAEYVASNGSYRHLSVIGQVVITISYVIGAIGNLAALTILCRSEKKLRNSKHSLMLRCLASNDLVALLGMLVQMNLQLYLPKHLASSRWLCMFRVIWRLFGLGSGCVAIVMAIERWLALTRPFLYQKHVTYYVIRRAIFSLWAAVLVLVCLPFFGFGTYYEASTSKCVRYRTAEEPKDIAYAYVFFSFGTLLSVCIVWCNLAVIRVLCHMGCHGDRKRTVIGRRISRSSSRNRSLLSSQGDEVNASTPEELAFARLMAVLCIFFVICWMPQMITIPMAQLGSSKSSKVFFRIADILMAMHFTLDPYIYVILRCQRRPCFQNMMKMFCHSCWTGGATTPATSLAMTEQERALSHSRESNKTNNTHMNGALV